MDQTEKATHAPAATANLGSAKRGLSVRLSFNMRNQLGCAVVSRVEQLEPADRETLAEWARSCSQLVNDDADSADPSVISNDRHQLYLRNRMWDVKEAEYYERVVSVFQKLLPEFSQRQLRVALGDAQLIYGGSELQQQHMDGQILQELQPDGELGLPQQPQRTTSDPLQDALALNASE